MTTKIVGHTPGPWEDHTFTVRKNGIIVADVCVEQINRKNKPPAEYEANARLIAAGPELLEALETLIDEMERKYVPHGVDGLPDCWNRLMIAARKARGE